MNAEKSLAEAQAARRAQERKLAAERPVKARLDRLAAEDDLAALLRDALSGPGRR